MIKMKTEMSKLNESELIYVIFDKYYDNNTPEINEKWVVKDIKKSVRRFGVVRNYRGTTATVKNPTGETKYRHFTHYRLGVKSHKRATKREKNSFYCFLPDEETIFGETEI